MIRVLDLDVPRSAITKLALRFHHNGNRGLGNYMGHAIDQNHDELILDRRAYEPILAELARDPIPGLEELARRLREAP